MVVVVVVVIPMVFNCSCHIFCVFACVQFVVSSTFGAQCCCSDLSPELHEVTLVLFSDECLDVHEQRYELSSLAHRSNSRNNSNSPGLVKQKTPFG